MKVLITLLAFALGSSLSSGADRGLQQIKAQFPQYVTGPITEKSDPIVRECFLKYQSAVDRMTDDNVATALGQLRHMVDADIKRYERQLEKPPATVTYSMKRGIQTNVQWLRSKMLPFLKQVERIQKEGKEKS